MTTLNNRWVDDLDGEWPALVFKNDLKGDTKVKTNWPKVSTTECSVNYDELEAGEWTLVRRKKKNSRKPPEFSPGAKQ